MDWMKIKMKMMRKRGCRTLVCHKFALGEDDKVVLKIGPH